MAGLSDLSREEIESLLDLARREKQQADKGLVLARSRVVDADRVVERLEAEAERRTWPRWL
jgi:hypothetical protein